MSAIILGIESSCDDTSAAVIKDGYLLSNVVSSQAVHEAYGGVVPISFTGTSTKYRSGGTRSTETGRGYQRRTECGSFHVDRD